MNDMPTARSFLFTTGQFRKEKLSVEATAGLLWQAVLTLRGCLKRGREENYQGSLLSQAVRTHGLS